MAESYETPAGTQRDNRKLIIAIIILVVLCCCCAAAAAIWALWTYGDQIFYGIPPQSWLTLLTA
ncbi:MAG: hypothetical protein GX495_08405 [Chloroflexi bacterium]|jgi:flagellar basal body-associated protein FliL|nr:hypothetical protein [Chloroflexota bacterium]